MSRVLGKAISAAKADHTTQDLTSTHTAPGAAQCYTYKRHKQQASVSLSVSQSTPSLPPAKTPNHHRPLLTPQSAPPVVSLHCSTPTHPADSPHRDSTRGHTQQHSPPAAPHHTPPCRCSCCAKPPAPCCRCPAQHHPTACAVWRRGRPAGTAAQGKGAAAGAGRRQQ